MTTCQHIDSLVSAVLEHEASPAEMRFVESHLPSCSRCRAQIREVSLAMEALNQLPRLETRAEFTDLVLARTRGLRAAELDSREPWIMAPRFTPRHVLRWGVPLAAAAALALALVTLQMSHRYSETETASSERATETSHPASPVEPVAPGSNATAAINSPVIPPEVIHYGKGEGKSLGMARDSYALGTYELRTPREGGTPILTPVAAKPDLPVVVTF
jgi:anti-sigma factor RsiW